MVGDMSLGEAEAAETYCYVIGHIFSKLTVLYWSLFHIVVELC